MEYKSATHIKRTEQQSQKSLWTEFFDLPKGDTIDYRCPCTDGRGFNCRDWPWVGCVDNSIDRATEFGLFLLLWELDRDIVEYWKQNCPSLNLYHEDALKVDWEFILGQHQEGVEWKVVSNLPYNVGTPILSRLLIQPQVNTLVVMMQKEVVERDFGKGK